MNITGLIFLILSSLILNVAVYWVFKKFILKTESPALKFFGLNLTKDILWVLFWLMELEKNTFNFLAVTAVFLLTSVYLYFKVIRIMNKS